MRWGRTSCASSGNAMRELLFLTHRLPYPPNKGDKIRSYHMLRYLQRHFRVHLGAFIDDPQDERHADALAACCASARFVRLSPRTARWRSLVGLVAGQALSLHYYRSRQLQRWVQATLAQHDITVALAFSSPMAQYLPAATARGTLHRVMDLVDVDSEKWRAYADGRSSSTVQGWLYRREARLLAQEERHIARSFAHTVLVSAAEAQLLRKLAPDCAHRIGHVANGVDSGYFTPDYCGPSPYHAAVPGGGGRGDASHAVRLVFTGALDYLPNRMAVDWFARRVMPALRARCGAVEFHAVGARPGSDILVLAGLPGVAVHANVPDVRPYLRHATLAVAPLQLARGVQNKVLEAMAMAKTVVVTPAACTGIEAVAGVELLVAEGVAGFVDCIAAELAAPTHCGAAARRRVLADHGWERNLDQLGALLQCAPSDGPGGSGGPLPDGGASVQQVRHG